MSDEISAKGTKDVSDVQFGEVMDSSEKNNLSSMDNQRSNLEMLYDIPLRVTVRLGETQISIKDLLTLGPGAVIELNKLAGESIDLLINGVLVGTGDVVVVNENFGLRITSIISPEDRLKDI